MSTSFEILNQAFPGRLLLTPREAATVVGWSYQTFRSRRFNKNLPFPIVEDKGRGERPRVLVRVEDLARYVDELTTKPPKTAAQQPSEKDNC